MKYKCGDLVRKLDRKNNVSKELYVVLDKIGYLIVVKKEIETKGFEYVKASELKIAKPISYK